MKTMTCYCPHHADGDEDCRYCIGCRASEKAVKGERERCARIAENVRGGYSANIRISKDEQEFSRDKDGPWVLNSDVAREIRGS